MIVFLLLFSLSHSIRSQVPIISVFQIAVVQLDYSVRLFKFNEAYRFACEFLRILSCCVFHVFRPHTIPRFQKTYDLKWNWSAILIIFHSQWIFQCNFQKTSLERLPAHINSGHFKRPLWIEAQFLLSIHLTNTKNVLHYFMLSIYKKNNDKKEGSIMCQLKLKLKIVFPILHEKQTRHSDGLRSTICKLLIVDWTLSADIIARLYICVKCGGKKKKLTILSNKQRARFMLCLSFVLNTFYFECCCLLNCGCVCVCELVYMCVSITHSCSSEQRLPKILKLLGAHSVLPSQRKYEAHSKQAGSITIIMPTENCSDWK